LVNFITGYFSKNIVFTRDNINPWFSIVRFCHGHGHSMAVQWGTDMSRA
jgi:hypothetical protein